MTKLSRADTASTSERVLTWRAGVSAVAERPVLGWGPGSFLAAFRLNRPDV
jgi:O-antigen ligase